MVARQVWRLKLKMLPFKGFQIARNTTRKNGCGVNGNEGLDLFLYYTQ